MPGLSREEKADILRKMLTIRLFEKKIEQLFSKGEIYGTTHLYVGQEANAVGICTILKDGDLVSSYHRGHGHAIARGLNTRYLMAEITGKETGYCKGKGGTQHISSLKDGFIGTNGITGGLVPISLGAALSSKMQKKGNIVVAFIGDGALGEGVTLESFNMAALWKLPVIFYCENNLYAMSTHVSDAIAPSEITAIPAGFGIKTFVVNGNDVLDVIEKGRQALKIIIDGGGPVFIEAKTYRYLGHSKSDMREYRTRDEENFWISKCPIENLKAHMVNSGELTQHEFDSIEREVSDLIESSVDFAKQSKELDASSMFDDLY